HSPRTLRRAPHADPQYADQRRAVSRLPVLLPPRIPPPPSSPLFPYTTLFRSRARRHGAGARPDGEARGRAAAHCPRASPSGRARSEEHTSELQSPYDLVCRLLLEKKKNNFRRLLIICQSFFTSSHAVSAGILQ